MSRYVVHIGPHKTGTTTIQQYLSDNRDKLLEQGIDFPTIGRTERGAQAHRYFSAFMRDQRDEYPNDFLLEASDWTPDADTVFLSSEDFWFGSEPDKIARLMYLTGRIDRIIVFLRDPVDHLLSHYRESIKSGNSKTFTEFANLHTRQLLEPERSFAYYRYAENISRWRLAGDVVEVVYRTKMDLLLEFFSAAGSGHLDRTLMQPSEDKNIASADANSALLHVVNKLASCGEIDKEAQRLFKKRLAKSDPKLLAEMFSNLLQPTDCDVRDFIDAFVEKSPAYFSLLSSKSAISINEFPSERHDEVVSLLKREGLLRMMP